MLPYAPAASANSHHSPWAHRALNMPGQCKTPEGNHGRFNTQARARDTPDVLVAVSPRVSRVWPRLLRGAERPPGISKSRNLEISRGIAKCLWATTGV
jgi:hypothetical protein